MKITESQLKKLIKEEIIKEFGEPNTPQKHRGLNAEQLANYVFDHWYEITDQSQEFAEEGEFPDEIVKFVHSNNVDFEEFSIEYGKFVDLENDEWGDDDFDEDTFESGDQWGDDDFDEDDLNIYLR